MRHRTLTSRTTILFAVTALAAMAAAVTPASASAHGPSTRRACSTARPGWASCLALVRTDVRVRAQALRPSDVPAGVGFGAADLQSAYALPSATAGAGETVAIVDAYDLPTAASDLAAYRAANGLPACTAASGCFRKVNEHGSTSYLPTPDPNWGVEIALDIEMVSASCPNCKILLVEADQPDNADLGAAEDAAARTAGVVAISNSWGGPESFSQLTDDAKHFNHPGIAITASTGDGGYVTGWPASSHYVTAIGGTSLVKDTSARGWSETAWFLAGSGCSAVEPKPAWQHDPGCPTKSSADVSAVADPSTGVAVYDSFEIPSLFWLEVGGTSVASPFVAGVYALAGKPKAATYPASYPYRHPTALNDVTSGNNSFGAPCDPTYECNAGPGYDGPTGLGTPNGVAAFRW